MSRGDLIEPCTFPADQWPALAELGRRGELLQIVGVEHLHYPLSPELWMHKTILLCAAVLDTSATRRGLARVAEAPSP